jgi:hypothetical protein
VGDEGAVVGRENPPSPKSHIYIAGKIQKGPEQHLEEASVKLTGCPTQTGFGEAVNKAIGASNTVTVNEAFELHVSLVTVTE